MFGMPCRRNRSARSAVQRQIRRREIRPTAAERREEMLSVYQLRLRRIRGREEAQKEGGCGDTLGDWKLTVHQLPSSPPLSSFIPQPVRPPPLPKPTLGGTIAADLIPMLLPGTSALRYGILPQTGGSDPAHLVGRPQRPQILSEIRPPAGWKQEERGGTS